jgi:hypothetical protein
MDRSFEQLKVLFSKSNLSTILFNHQINHIIAYLIEFLCYTNKIFEPRAWIYLKFMSFLLLCSLQVQEDDCASLKDHYQVQIII